VAKLDGETEPVCRSPVLADDRQVGVVDCLQPDQFVRGSGQRHEAVPLGG